MRSEADTRGSHWPRNRQETPASTLGCAEPPPPDLAELRRRRTGRGFSGRSTSAFSVQSRQDSRGKRRPTLRRSPAAGRRSCFRCSPAAGRRADAGPPPESRFSSSDGRRQRAQLRVSARGYGRLGGMSGHVTFTGRPGRGRGARPRGRSEPTRARTAS